MGKTVMSTPVSAMISWAARTPTPGISSRVATAWAKGAISSSTRASSEAMSADRSSMRRSIRRHRSAW
nr:hypothetical protein [Kribbella sp. VKM Ac-2527]